LFRWGIIHKAKWNVLFLTMNDCTPV
jgi:hypothetical protein